MNRWKRLEAVAGPTRMARGTIWSQARRRASASHGAPGSGPALALVHLDGIEDGPDNAFVADLIGKTNFIDGTVVAARASGGDDLAVDAALGVLMVRGGAGLARGAAARVAIRPENVVFADGGADAPNTVAGTIRHKAFLGNMTYCEVAAGDETLHLQVHPGAAGAVGDAAR